MFAASPSYFDFEDADNKTAAANDLDGIQVTIPKLLQIFCLFCTFLHGIFFLLLFLNQFFQGIPPHIALLSEMKGTKEDFWMMKEALLAQFKNELDERCIGGARFFNMKSLMEKMDDI